MGASVTFQVEGVIEALAAERAEVTFDVAVALDVAVEQTLEGKHLVAHPAYVLVVLCLHTCDQMYSISGIISHYL